MMEAGNPALHELRQLHALIENNTDWIWEIDSEARFVYSSVKGSQLLGYETGHILGRTIYDFMPNREIIRLAPEIQAIKSGQKPCNGLVVPLRRSNGTLAFVETNAVPVIGPDGHYSGYRGISRDISSVWTHSHLLGALFNLAPVLLWVIDRDIRYIAINAAQSELIDISTKELIGQQVSGTRPERAEQLRHDLALADAGLPIPDREIPWKGRHFQVSTNPIRDMSGVVIALSVASSDITELKLAEQALAEARSQLDQLTGQADADSH